MRMGLRLLSHLQHYFAPNCCCVLPFRNSEDAIISPKKGPWLFVGTKERYEEPKSANGCEGRRSANRDSVPAQDAGLSFEVYGSEEGGGLKTFSALIVLS